MGRGLPVKRSALTPASLTKAAQRRTGLSDFGSDSYLPGLEALTYSLASEARLNQLGRIVMGRQIVDALANRLTVVAWEKANPELASAPVRAPLIILGLGRTGTTILQETLASAPHVRTPLQWEITDYSLVHTVRNARSDKRIKRLQKNIDRTDRVMPGLSAIHFYDAFTPSECFGLIALDMCSEHFSAMAWAPTYRTFLLSHDHRTVYDWHLRGLRYLQATTPGVRWVLKSPTHAAYLDALLATYPDAKIVNPHRDPTEVVGSVCSLFATLRRGLSDHTNIAEQARNDADYAADVIRRATAFRRGHPEVANQFCDISFRSFIADPEGTLQHIYDHFAMTLTPADRTAMLHYLDSRPREKYGKHSYTLAQFGLGKDAVPHMFDDYIQQFADHM